MFRFSSRKKPMKISKVGVSLIKHWEGFRADSYLCPAGVWTIGYGHTGKVNAGMKVSPEEAEKLLIHDLRWAEKTVRNFVKVDLTQNQYDALVSFVFNVGSHAFRTSTMLRLLNEGKSVTEICEQFGRWVLAGGDVLRGLVNRREMEENLFRGVKPDV